MDLVFGLNAIYVADKLKSPEVSRKVVFSKATKSKVCALLREIFRSFSTTNAAVLSCVLPHGAWGQFLLDKNRQRICFSQVVGFDGFDKLGPFSSHFLMRKRLSSGQKWFLRPYFPLIRGMFVFRSGLRFSFQALEVPESRVRKRSFSLTKMTFPQP